MSLVTSPQILAIHGQKKAELAEELEANITRQKQQQAQELDLITQANVCPVEAIPNQRLTGLEPAQLQALLKNSFFDPKVLQATLCAMDALIYTQPNSQGTLASNE